MPRCNVLTAGLSKVLFICLSLVASGSVSHAAVVYSYSGPKFDDANGLFDTSMSVSGWFSVQEPLVPTGRSQDIGHLILDYHFSDGLFDFKLDGPGFLAPRGISGFGVQIDSRGLTRWSIGLHNINALDELRPGQDHRLLQLFGFATDPGFSPAETFENGETLAERCVSITGPNCFTGGKLEQIGVGSWNRQTSVPSESWTITVVPDPPAEVPLPTGLALLASALGFLGLLGKRRKGAA